MNEKSLANIAIIGLALFCCKSKEANWVLIKEDPSTRVFVDDRSITRISESSVRARVKFKFCSSTRGWAETCSETGEP